MSRNWFLFLKIIFTFFLFYLIFRWVNFDSFLLTLQTARLKPLIFAVLLWPLSLLIVSLRWKIILNEYEINLSLSEAFDISWISSFFSNFLPTSIGGDSYRFLRINDLFERRKKEILSSILIDRGIGLVGMLIIGCLFGLLFWEKIADEEVLLTIYLGVICFTLVILTIIFYPSLPVLSKEYSVNIFNQAKDLYNLLASFNHNGVLVTVTFLSVIFYMINIFATYLAFSAFDSTVSFLLLSFLIPIVGLSELVPISINSMGIREGFAMFIFAYFTINKEIVLSVFLVMRVLLILVTLTGGVRFLILSSTKHAKGNF